MHRSISTLTAVSTQPLPLTVTSRFLDNQSILLQHTAYVSAACFYYCCLARRAESHLAYWLFSSLMEETISQQHGMPASVPHARFGGSTYSFFSSFRWVPHRSVVAFGAERTPTRRSIPRRFMHHGTAFRWITSRHRTVRVYRPRDGFFFFPG